MKKALVIGTGTIGGAVLLALENAGYETEGVSRNSKPLINIEDPVSVKQFFSGINLYDVIVCAAGNATFGALKNLDEKDFNESINSKLMGQVRVIREGLGCLNTEGIILVTGGMFAFDPWPETSALAMVNSGLEGFVRAVNKETVDGKRVCIVHPPFISETAVKSGMDPAPWPEAAIVARTYIKQILNETTNSVLYVDGYKPKVI